MNRIPVWIDCDPGIDDAVMLALAGAARDLLDVRGISSVAGNQSSDLVTENALTLASFFGMPDVPVLRGATHPLVKKPEVAAHIHGENGLGDARFPKSSAELVPGEAIDYLKKEIFRLPEGQKMTLVATGPLTNMAALLIRYPETKERIEKIVLMGGSSVGGNATPYAEFNIYVDPDAAKLVFGSGLPIVMAPLDVTGSSGLLPEQIDLLAAAREEADPEDPVAQMLRFYKCTTAFERVTYVNVHDATTILYLTEPETFSGRQVTVDVICGDAPRVGETVCTDDPEGHVLLLNHVDTERMQEVILAALT